jgi:hypothetical protein
MTPPSDNLKERPRQLPCLARVTYPQGLLCNGASAATVEQNEIVIACEYVKELPAWHGEIKCLTSKGIGFLAACWLEAIET